MTASSDVLISLSSFGAAEVRRHGQLWFTRAAHAAGADGVEVRGELLANPAIELPELAACARELSLYMVYSSPEGLWGADGRLDHAALERALDACATLATPRLKMALGACADPRPDLPGLAQRVDAAGIELLIENDQTPAAGTLPALRDFFAAAGQLGLPFGMTFDIGNWHWTGECPQDAARALASQVRYVHCKGVERKPGRWVAVPLAESLAPWRSILRALPAAVPWAIEYPLAGDDLLAVTRREIAQLRAVATALASCDGESA